MKYAMYIGASEDQVRWGGNDDPRDLLTMGETYAVKDVEVHSWHTMYILCDFPGKKFNSVSFKDVVPSKVAQPTTAKLIKEFSDRITAMKKHGKPSDAALIAKNVLLYESTIAYLQDIDRLQSELSNGWKWNQSVSVCQDHTREVVNYDGCVICDIDRLQSELEACRRDADRYRWLVRNRDGSTICFHTIL